MSGAAATGGRSLIFPPGNSLAVAQNGPAPPTSSALTIIRLFRAVIESSNARAARLRVRRLSASIVGSRFGGSRCIKPSDRRNDDSGTFCPVLSFTDKAGVQILDSLRRREAAVRHQAADWTSPVNAARIASSRSASVKPRCSCSRATTRSTKTPRFSNGTRSAAAQTDRSCESVKATM